MEALLRSEEVRMIMDALRNAKRFHATVAFSADTELRMLQISVGLFSFSLGSMKLMYSGSPQVQPTDERLPAKQFLLLHDLDKVHESLTLVYNQHANCPLPNPPSSPTS